MLEPGPSVFLSSLPDREGVGVKLNEREVVPSGERREVGSDGGGPSRRVGSRGTFELRSSDGGENAKKSEEKGKKERRKSAFVSSGVGLVSSRSSRLDSLSSKSSQDVDALSPESSIRTSESDMSIPEFFVGLEGDLRRKGWRAKSQARFDSDSIRAERELTLKTRPSPLMFPSAGARSRVKV